MWEEASGDTEGPPHSSELGNPSPGRTTNPGLPSMLLADTYTPGSQLPVSSSGSLQYCLVEKGHLWPGLTVSLARQWGELQPPSGQRKEGHPDNSQTLSQAHLEGRDSHAQGSEVAQDTLVSRYDSWEEGCIQRSLKPCQGHSCPQTETGAVSAHTVSTLCNLAEGALVDLAPCWAASLGSSVLAGFWSPPALLS